MAAKSTSAGFEPNWSTHPGEHLEECLSENGWSQAELARRAGMTPKLVSEIISGKNPVTPETALKLERVLGLKGEIWLRLQASWDLFQARKREADAAQKRSKPKTTNANSTAAAANTGSRKRPARSA